jgi:hypothetical protein
MQERTAPRFCSTDFVFPFFLFPPSVRRLGGGWWILCFQFAGVLGLHESFQASQARVPEGAVLVEPVIHGPQRFGIEMVETVAAFPMLIYQVCPAQQPKVL